MANPYPALITDANSETRIAGQIDFSDPANQPGFTPVAIVLTRSALDIHALGLHTMAWTGLVDNVWDFNTVAALPANLGLTLKFDGSDANITTTTAGVWAFTLSVSIPADTAWTGNVVLPFIASGSGFISTVDSPVADPFSLITLSETIALASGDGPDSARIETLHVATAGALNALGFMQIVRLA